MAGPFYVDIGSPAAWNGNDGTNNSTEVWKGISGLQYGFDTVAAGEILYIKGTGDLSKFYNVEFDAQSGNLTLGEGVSWGSGGTAGTGVVTFPGAFPSATATVEIEVLTGVAPANDLTITGATSGSTITPTANIAQKTLNLDTKAGTLTDGLIRYVGVNSSWAIDETRAFIDANSSPVDIITMNATPDFIAFENIEVKDNAGTTKSGWYAANAGLAGLYLVNCCANNVTGYGFNFSNAFGSFVYRCAAYSCGQAGFYGPNQFVLCCGRNNTMHGFLLYGGGVTFGCIAVDNSDDGIQPEQNCWVYNCVADGNSDDGISYASGGVQNLSAVFGSRITNHSGSGDIGIYCQNINVIIGHTYLENNAGDNIQVGTGQYYEIKLEGGSSTSNVEDQSDTDYGYVDRDGKDYATDYTDATDPSIRRRAVTIPWS